jgi:hypothetical protein
MADHAAQGAVELGGIVDVAEHERTYRSFLGLVKYASAGIAILLILMAFFLL